MNLGIVHPDNPIFPCRGGFACSSGHTDGPLLPLTISDLIVVPGSQLFFLKFPGEERLTGGRGDTEGRGGC